MKEYVDGIYIKLKPSERELIKSRMKEAGIINMSAYIRKMAIDGYVIRLDLSELNEVTRLFRITSNNINQYARKCRNCSMKKIIIPLNILLRDDIITVVADYNMFVYTEDV